jgi:hypothetical protein
VIFAIVFLLGPALFSLTTNLTNLTNTQVVIPESREADSSGIYFNRLAK